MRLKKKRKGLERSRKLTSKAEGGNSSPTWQITAKNWHFIQLLPGNEFSTELVPQAEVREVGKGTWRSERTTARITVVVELSQA